MLQIPICKPSPTTIKTFECSLFNKKAYKQLYQGEKYIHMTPLRYLMLKHNLFVREIVVYVCTSIQGLYWLPTFIHYVNNLYHAKCVVKRVQSVIVTCVHKLIILVRVNVILT